MKPIDLPCEPPIRPELAIIDTHVHLWNALGYDYFAAEYLEDVRLSGHQVLATVSAECNFGHWKDGPEALRPVGETAFVFEQSKLAVGSGVRLSAGIMGASDLRLGAGIREVMEAHIEAGGGQFRGIRWRGAFIDDPTVQYEEPGYPPREVMGDTSVIEAARVMQDMGLTLGVLIFYTQVDALAGLARHVPDMPIAINHTANPIGFKSYADRQNEVFRDWSAAMQRAAQIPNVNIQIGGFGGSRIAYHPKTVPASSDDLAARWQDWVDVCMESFGPERVLFDSNFPVDRRLASYGTYINAFKKMLSGYSDDEQRQVFSENARRVYRID